jgi:hypothetical protein
VREIGAQLDAPRAALRSRERRVQRFHRSFDQNWYLEAP